ncbi:15-O-acetyltransferase Tri3-domain-containing protein [Xylogone sp. PMI_703]|nr:15-O-acetyltransferase Tri3-domain-containing protein [Xylogone sp. PMI_703]
MCFQQLTTTNLHRNISTTQLKSTTTRTMASPPFPPLNPDNYRWHEDYETASWVRRACGIENLDGMEVPNKKGHNDFYIAVTSKFHDPQLTVLHISRAFKEVWFRTRFHHPQIACVPLWRDGQLFLSYRPPQDDDEAIDWVNRTVKVELGWRSSEEVYLEAGERRRESGASQKASPAATVLILAPVKTINDRVSITKVTFIFQFNHIFFDGSAAYTLIGQVLDDLAVELGAPKKPESFRWEKSVDNLTPAFVEILSGDQELSGGAYERALKRALNDTMTSQSSWGLTPSGSENGTARTEFQLLTAAETDNIRAAAKKSGFGISHLAHAAVFLVGLQINPPAKKNENEPEPFIASYFALDDRQYIDKMFKQFQKRYLANCHGHGNVRVDNIRNWVLGPEVTSGELCRNLVAVGTQIKNSYDECMRRPSRVSAGLTFMEMLAGMLSAGPHPDAKPMTTPLLVSNGAYDRWIAPSIDHPKTKAQFISNLDVRLYANNYHPFPSFHISSFRGRCILSVQYDDGYYEKSEISEYLGSVAEMMLAFAAITGPIPRSML